MSRADQGSFVSWSIISRSPAVRHAAHKQNVERWLRDLTDRRLRRGVFRSVPALIEAIQNYIDRHNDTDQGFAWTAKAEEILAKVRRARAVLNKTPSA